LIPCLFELFYRLLDRNIGGILSSSDTKDFVRAYGKIEKLEDYRIKWLARFVYSDAFELAIATVIATNAVALAILTFPNITEETRNTALLIDSVCLVIYVGELLIRILSYGSKPWKFFSKGWNIFDFLIIASTPIFAGQTVVLRLLRLFRLVRIFRFLPEVRILSSSIIKSLPPLLSMGALIALLLFLYGMVGHYLFGSQLPVAWGTISASMMSLVILLTLENFPIYLEEALAVNALAVPYLLSYVFIIVFTVLNLLIGIVLNAMDEAREEAKVRTRDLKEFQLLANDVEQITSDGEVTKEEMERLRSEIARLRKLVSPDS
jgi:voltage-gated sodium channel